jgi:hypothetical protein
MKRIWITKLGMLIVVGLSGFGCHKARTDDISSQGVSSTNRLDNFLILKKFEDGEANYTISFEDGRYAFGISGHDLTVILHNHGTIEMMTLKLNPTNDMIAKTVLNLPDGSSIIGNADGVPVKKVMDDLSSFIFTGGEFVPARNNDKEQGTNHF